MYQLHYGLFTPERRLPRRLLAAIAITTVVFSFSHADGQLTEDHVNTLNLSYVGAQRTEVVAHAAKSHTNDGRQDLLKQSKYEALIDSSTAPGERNMRKKKRSAESVTRRVSQGMSNSGPCELGWTFNGNSCYKLTSLNGNWSQAQWECRSMRSLLAEVENSNEQDALHDFLSSQELPVVSAWIGLSDHLNESVWTWGSGLPMDYSNWFRDEPNNVGGAEHCVNVWPHQLSRWNDYGCNATFPGVCQKDVAHLTVL